MLLSAPHQLHALCNLLCRPPTKHPSFTPFPCLQFLACTTQRAASAQRLLASPPVVHQALMAADAASMSGSAGASSSNSSRNSSRNSSSAYTLPSSAAIGSLNQQLVAAYSSFAVADGQ